MADGEGTIVIDQEEFTRLQVSSSTRASYSIVHITVVFKFIARTSTSSSIYGVILSCFADTTDWTENNELSVEGDLDKAECR